MKSIKRVNLKDIIIVCPEHGEQQAVESRGTGIVLACGGLFWYCGPYGFRLEKHQSVNKPLNPTAKAGHNSNQVDPAG